MEGREAEMGIQVRTIKRDNRKKYSILEGEKKLKMLTKALGNEGGDGQTGR